VVVASPSDDVIQPLPQIHLLDRWPGPLNFRSGIVACDVAPSDTLGRSLCKSRLRFLLLDIDPVVRCVVAPAVTALRLLPRGRTPTKEVEVPTRDAPGCLSEVSLCVSDALAMLALQRALWNYVRLYRHSQSAEVGD